MKVRCVNNKGVEFPELIEGAIYTVESINEVGSYFLKEIPKYNVWCERFEIVSECENNVNENIKKDIRDVMRDIKEDEVWCSENYLIYLNEQGVCISRNDYVMTTDWCFEKERFVLQSVQYSFQEAFEAYEKGKEIKSAVSGNSAKQNELYGRTHFAIDEIKGKWYIK